MSGRPGTDERDDAMSLAQLQAVECSQMSEWRGHATVTVGDWKPAKAPFQLDPQFLVRQVGDGDEEA